MLRLLTATLSLAALCASAAAGPAVLEHERGATVGVASMYGGNRENDFDFFGGTYGLIQVGYRHSTGTELVLDGGTSPGAAREVVTFTYGATLRQRLRLGPVDPFVEAGFHQAGPNTGDPLTFGYGVGVDVRLPHDLEIGVAGGQFAGEDTRFEPRLDWYLRVQVGGIVRF